MTSQLFSRESLSEAAASETLQQSNIMARRPIRLKQFRRSVWNIFFQFVDPNGGLRVAGRAPIAARRERTAGTDFGAVRNRRPFELADLEKTEQKNFQPL